MNEYETLFITTPTLSDEETDDLAAQMEIFVREKGSKLKVEKWGRRKLAYEIDHQKDGYFYLFEMETEPEVIEELERRLRLHDKVLRFLTVRVDIEKRRAKKLAEARGVPPPWERERSDDEDDGGEEE